MPANGSHENPALSLACYGEARHTYRGTGKLRADDGRTYDCVFTAGQFPSGRIVVLAECGKDAYPLAYGQCASFDGVAQNGFRLNSAKEVHEVNHLPEIPKDAGPGVWVALVLQRLEVEIQADVAPHTIEYDLTNVALPPRSVHPPTTGARSILQRTSEYSNVISRLQVQKDIQVTGVLQCPVDPLANSSESEAYARSVCDVLSVASGTPVEWITSSHKDANGTPIRRVHNEGVTKDYSGHHLIPHSKPEAFQRFLEMALPAYQRKREKYRLDRGIIASYLDAKAEHDFLELRGVKATVAMELLRTTMLSIPQVGLSKTILDDDAFTELSPLIESALTDRIGCRASRDDKRAMLAHLPAMNRRSFQNHMRRMVKFLDAGISKEEQALFIACRNKLVHECSFYCQAAKEADRAKDTPLETPWAEYCFLIHVLDRLFLALLEYSGDYYDWTVGGGPKLRSFVWQPHKQKAEQ